MRLIKTITFFALLLYGVLFCVQNFQKISLTIPFISQIDNIPLFLVIIACLICGVLIGSLISTTKDIKNFFSNKTVKSENKNLKKKIEIIETEKTIQQNLLDN
jgi:uncharacterized integral membrane protein